MAPGVWAEQMEDAAIEPLLADLGALGLGLHLSLPAARVGDPGLSRLTRRAAEMGVVTYTWFGPDLVHSYARSAVARWGARAGVDLGVVGDYGVALDPGTRYPDPGALYRDVAAALGAGITASHVRVYGLQGLAQAGGISRWMDWTRVLPEEPPRRPSVALLRALGRGFDGTLGVRDYFSARHRWQRFRSLHPGQDHRGYRQHQHHGPDRSL